MRSYDVPSTIYGVSFVDITATGVTRGESKFRNQQRNWDTVLQIFGLLTQPIVLEEPEPYTYTKQDQFEGSELYNIIGTQHQFTISMLRPDTKFWVFCIGSEREDVLQKEKLEELFDLIPVIGGLDETIRLQPSAFQTQDLEFVNIAFFPTPSTR
jgi:hypothetical protein